MPKAIENKTQSLMFRICIDVLFLWMGWKVEHHACDAKNSIFL